MCGCHPLLRVPCFIMRGEGAAKSSGLRWLCSGNMSFSSGTSGKRSTGTSSFAARNTST